MADTEILDFQKILSHPVSHSRNSKCYCANSPSGVYRSDTAIQNLSAMPTTRSD